MLWNVGPYKVNLRSYEITIITELKNAGYIVDGDPSALFPNDEHTDIEIGVNITTLNEDLCTFSNAFINYISGKISFSVQWQVYSTVQRKILLTKDMKGTADTAKIGTRNLLDAALVQSLDDLLRTDEFHAILSQGPAETKPSTGDKSAIVLAGAEAAKPMPIPDAIGSVVLILSGGGHGSGFLVSSDGYVLTAEHVVGSDKYLKIRWSDGLEGVGEVVRTDKRRDVALVKVDPRGRPPLAMRRVAPQPGDTVFAIGAPLDAQLQSTVTRGVASANRILDGFAFIQSDVTVNPGNSGGPLLDEKGQVLGVTDWAVRERAGGGTGLNFFVPINDALLFLAAEPR
jgi:S1-C subfamily serine protease